MHLDTEEDTNPKNIEDIEDAKEDHHADQHQPQAEDLSHKSSRGESPPSSSSSNRHKTITKNTATTRYHPYCHSEILIKSE